MGRWTTTVLTTSTAIAKDRKRKENPKQQPCAHVSTDVTPSPHPLQSASDWWLWPDDGIPGNPALFFPSISANLELLLLSCSWWRWGRCPTVSLGRGLSVMHYKRQDGASTGTGKGNERGMASAWWPMRNERPDAFISKHGSDSGESYSRLHVACSCCFHARACLSSS